MQLKVEQLCQQYGRHLVLKNLEFQSPGDDRVLCLIGPSGGGKSTLLRLLGGLEAPSSGEVSWEGQQVNYDERSMRTLRRECGFVFQQFNLFPHLTVEENIVLPLVKVHGWTRADADDRATEILDRFGVAGHGQKAPADLSGGQQQRVALARAVAHRPKRLFLDEPTSALDPEMTAEVLDAIREFVDGGQQIVLATHEMGFVRALDAETLLIADGMVVESGSAAAMLDAPMSEFAQRFFAKVMRY